MNLIVLLKSESGLAKLVEGPRVERVQALWTLDREDGDAFLTFDEQVVKRHGGCPICA